MKKEIPPRILAIASAGGHWVQLMRLRPAWEGCTVYYVSTSANRKREVIQDAKNRDVSPPAFYVVIEASRWEKFKLVRQFLQITKILLQVRPDVIISTGAAPGFFALRIGKLFGARTIWVDSIANSGEISLSGKKVGKSANLWLTQWEHLTVTNGNCNTPRYEGKVV
ncbi:MAG: UDP-N-acetylglucosamine--LPS N-acetylglucosamine transferase [Deltaproteobacteria bacterium]|nr:UDP-N-acetylglucosamine--LPS N-acetylglucosamine transferase [Deltaproteobacteria bacterium]